MEEVTRVTEQKMKERTERAAEAVSPAEVSPAAGTDLATAAAPSSRSADGAAVSAPTASAPDMENKVASSVPPTDGTPAAYPPPPAADGEEVIRFSHVTKVYKLYSNDRQRLLELVTRRSHHKSKVAVSDLSFSVHRGESVAFFGKNGAGKSTVLKMLTGVAYPTRGEITVNGRVSALLELTAGFDPEFTGRENIYFRGQLMGMSDEEIAEAEGDIVAFADLADYIDQPVRTYSSGMKARLGFALSVHAKPEILIVDEALSVGDAAFRVKCTAKIQEIMEEKDVTFLLVTHSTATARDFCRRGMVMRQGKLLLDSDIDSAITFYEDMLAKEQARRREKNKGILEK